MKLTHNKINNAIFEMETVVSKGQPFASRNKDRRIRSVLRGMRAEQCKPPTFKDIWFYFKLWAKYVKVISVSYLRSKFSQTL